MPAKLNEARANEILSGDPVTVGPFRVSDGQLEHLAANGTPGAAYPLAEVTLRTRGERSVAVAVVVAMTMLALDAGLWWCLGGGLLAMGAVGVVTLPLGALVVMALVHAPQLVVTHEGADHEWPFGNAEPLEVALLVMRSAQPEGTSLMAKGQTTHHLFFTTPPTERPDGVLASQLIDRSEPVMIHTVEQASLAAQHALMTSPNSKAYAVLRHVQHARFYRNIAVPDDQKRLITDWLEPQQVVVLRESDTMFLDGSLQVIAPDAPGRVPVSDDAVERRARTVAKLEAEGLRAPPLPPLRGTDEVVLREGPEVARRVLALGAVSMKASAIQHGETPPEDAYTTMWGPGLAHLSPVEAQAMEAYDPDAHGGLSWRFEAKVTLGWALGWLGEVPPLDALADPESTIVIPRNYANEEAVVAATVRPLADVLDLLDEVVCRRWLVVNAQQKGEAVPEGLNPSVLLERHYALNWLVQWGWADWDDVECPT